MIPRNISDANKLIAFKQASQGAYQEILETFEHVFCSLTVHVLLRTELIAILRESLVDNQIHTKVMPKRY